MGVLGESCRVVLGALKEERMGHARYPRFAASAHLPTPWLLSLHTAIEPTTARLSARVCSFLPQCKHQVPINDWVAGTRYTSRRWWRCTAKFSGPMEKPVTASRFEPATFRLQA